MVRATLPSGWDRDFEGRERATYVYAPRDLRLTVSPANQAPGVRASDRTSSRFFLRVDRPFDDRVGDPITIGEAATMAAAVRLAETYMRQIASGAIRTGGDAPTLDDATPTGDRETADPVAFLRGRLGDALVLVARPDDDGWTTLYAPDGDDPATVDADRSSAATVRVTDSGVTVWTPAGSGLLVVADRRCRLQVPGFVDDLERLLAGDEGQA